MDDDNKADRNGNNSKVFPISKQDLWSWRARVTVFLVTSDQGHLSQLLSLVLGRVLVVPKFFNVRFMEVFF